MRRIRATLMALVVILLSMLVAGPAQAGGPTSVLLVVPGVGQTASLYNSDADYNSLATLVGAFGSTDTGKVDPSGASHEAGAGVTVTWLIHDVQVWRVDRIYVVGDGEPWISSQVDVDGSSSIWTSPAVWHTATNGRKLTSLLDRLGVNPASLPGGDVAVSTGGFGPGPGTSAVPSVGPSAGTQAARKAQRQTTQNPAGLVWGFAGLVLGAVISVLAMRRFQNTTRKDAAAELGQPDATDPNWSPSDELSWPAPRR